MSDAVPARVPESVAIIGGGLAGFTTAQSLRASGYTGTVTIIDPEGTPYDRPPLSKDYLAGKADAEQLGFVPADWYAENSVEVAPHRVDSIDPDSGIVRCADGSRTQAEAIVLALGGRPRMLPVPGGDLPGLHVLRTRADADALRGELAAGRRVCIIGAGLIGAEVASTAVDVGCEVTLIDPVKIPLTAAVGVELANRLHAMHEEHGVQVVEGMTSSITHGEEGYVVTTEGPTAGEFPADVVLVAVGIVPNTELASTAGLDVDNGILVDPAQKTTHPRVWAVGDAARIRTADGILLRRHEHWESAMRSGETAAASILGRDLPRHGAAWMWTDRYGHHVEAIGDMTAGEPVVRTDNGSPSAEFRLDADGTMVGAAAIDPGTTIRAARRIIDRGIVVDQVQLADSSVPLKKLAR